jgi:hypothetical protein
MTTILRSKGLEFAKPPSTSIKSLKAENGTPCLTLTADTRPIYRLAKERCNHRHVGKMRIEALDLVAAKSENGSQMFI